MVIKLLLVLSCLLSFQVLAQSVTPTRVTSEFVIRGCTTTVNIIAPTQYSDNSAITNAPVYDIYERPPCGGSCRNVPWVQVAAKQLQGDISLSCVGKLEDHTFKGRPCHAVDNSVCAGFSYFIIGGAN